MTAIVGIKTAGGEDGIPGIVLAADSRETTEQPDGSVSKGVMQKLYTFEDRYAVAFTGTVNRFVDRFFSDLERGDARSFYKFLLREGAIPLDWGMMLLLATDDRAEQIHQRVREPKSEEIDALHSRDVAGLDMSSLMSRYIAFNYKAVPKGHKHPLTSVVLDGMLKMLTALNIGSRRKFKIDFQDEAMEMLVATREPVPELYHIDGMGVVTVVEAAEGIEYIALGSGAEFAKAYFDGGYTNDSGLDELERSARKAERRIRSCLGQDGIDSNRSEAQLPNGEPAKKDRRKTKRKRVIVPGNLSLVDVLDLSIRAIDKAIRGDESSGNLVEYVIATQGGILDYASLQRERIQDAKDETRAQAKLDYLRLNPLSESE